MRNYGGWLWLLAALFAVRVIAQPLALVLDAWFLPRFESWHSGLLPYPFLVTAQLLILGWLLVTAWRVPRVARPSRRVGGLLLIAAAVYGVTMVARLLLGATVLRDDRWFASPVPTAFHLVLAAYLFVYGHFNYSRG